jgi:8-oxo-dGTP pyrophosphatase MutT (NUDIX family)
VSQDALTPARVTLVDVYVVRLPAPGQVEALVLRRATGRSPGSWEAVHGHIEDGESPAEAAWREVIEEAGVTPSALYNLSRVESFYLHRLDSVVLVPVFAAIIDPAAAVRTSREHDAFEWLPLADAQARVSWPRSRRALEDVGALLATGDAGSVEDVLRVR